MRPHRAHPKQPEADETREDEREREKTDAWRGDRVVHGYRKLFRHGGTQPETTGDLMRLKLRMLADGLLESGLLLERNRGWESSLGTCPFCQPISTKQFVGAGTKCDVRTS